MFIQPNIKLPPTYSVKQEEKQVIKYDNGRFALVKNIGERCYIWGYYWNGQFKIVLVIKF